MDHQPKRADRREERKPHRNDMADQLVGQQHPELPRDHGVELALAMLSLTERIRNLARPHRLGRGSEEIEQDFKSLPRHAAKRLFEYFASTHEEAAQRVGNIGFADEAR